MQEKNIFKFGVEQSWSMVEKNVRFQP